MKKILLSCVTTLFAIGLLASCDTEEEVALEEPEITDNGEKDIGTSDERVTYKLGSKDETNHVYHWFDGTLCVIDSKSWIAYGSLNTTTNYEDGVDVYITAVSSDEIDNSCTLSFIDESGNEQYIGWNVTFGIGLIFDSTPHTWVWDTEEEIFYAPESKEVDYRAGTITYCFLAQDINSYFEGFYTVDDYLDYPHVTAYKEEPEPMENPNAGLNVTIAESLVSGSSYYLGCPADEKLRTYYLFYIRENWNYVWATQVLEDAVKVTVTGSDEEGWTLTFKLLEGDLQSQEEVEYTFYTYYNGSSSLCTIDIVKTDELEDTLTSRAMFFDVSSTFGWDATHNCVTSTFNDKTYYLAQDSRASNPDLFEMYAFLGDSQNTISFYSEITRTA